MVRTCHVLPETLEAVSSTPVVPAASGTPEMVAVPLPLLVHTRPSGRAEWARSGNG